MPAMGIMSEMVPSNGLSRKQLQKLRREAKVAAFFTAPDRANPVWLII
jgi:hypothetical protein